MLNLNTTFPILTPATMPGLPVLVDLNWLGRIMTQPDAGLAHHPMSHHSHTTPESDDSIIL